MPVRSNPQKGQDSLALSSLVQHGEGSVCAFSYAEHSWDRCHNGLYWQTWEPVTLRAEPGHIQADSEMFTVMIMARKSLREIPESRKQVFFFND